MKIVLDTNVLIDGLKDDNSYQKRIIDEVIAGHLEAYANHQTLQENRLLVKQLIDNPEYEKQIDTLFTQINKVVNRKQIRVVEDPEDNKILESAVESNAEYLITSDNALLKLGKYQNVQVISPAAFWIRYKDDGEDLWKQWAGFITNK